MYKLYLQKHDRNLATDFYINLLEKAAEKCFGEIEVVNDVKKIAKDDIVIIVAMYSLIAILRHRFNQKFIYWFQGVHAEEVTFGVDKISFKTHLRKLFLFFGEGLCLHRSKFNIFVSESMLMYYKQKYKYRGKNYFIMPCYNQLIEPKSFSNSEKYKKPSIVFAGAMLPWQCVDELFQMYAKLKKRLPEATLTILTKDKDQVNTLINKYNVTDVLVDFVPLEHLNDYMSKFKYGYLLRSDNIVNNVATPTKFNSYLAVGIIPIVSKTIHAYNSLTENMKYCVLVNNEKDIDTVVNKILDFEKVEIKGEEVLKEYSDIFDLYYNSEKYIDQLSKCFNLIR